MSKRKDISKMNNAQIAEYYKQLMRLPLSTVTEQALSEIVNKATNDDNLSALISQIEKES